MTLFLAGIFVKEFAATSHNARRGPGPAGGAKIFFVNGRKCDDPQAS